MRAHLLVGAIRSADVGQPTTVAIISGNTQQATAGQPVPLPCAVIVKDSSSVVLADVAVQWSINGDGSTGSIDDTSVTGVDGIASTTPTVGTIAGGYILTATVPGVGSVDFNVTAIAGTAAVIEIVAGNNQTVTVSTAVPILPKVKVHDGIGTGNAIQGHAVVFAVASGGGVVVGGSVATNAAGFASPTSWTLGASAGTNTLEAISAGLSGSPLTFTASGQSATATQIVVISGQTQLSKTAGVASGTPIILEVQDGSSNPVAGFTVTGAVTSGNGPGADITASVVSDVNGRVSFTPTPGQTAGGNFYELTATGLTNSPIACTVAGVAGVLANITFAVQPQSNVTAGVTWTQQPAVSLNDQFGNRRLSDSSTVSLAVIAGNAVFSGTTSGSASAGLKTFSGLGFSNGSGICQVRATSGAFTVDSNPISVSAPIPDHMGMGVQPTAIFETGTISPAVTVRILDISGNLVTGATTPVTVALSDNTEGAVLTGTLTVNAVGGTATFSNLSVDIEGSYTLTFSGGITGVVSASFAVSVQGASNEPVGYTLIHQQDFTAIGEDGFTLNTSGSANFTLIDPTTITDGQAFSPSGNAKVARFRFPNGQQGGNGPCNYFSGSYQAQGYNRLFMSFWLMLSNNFWGGPESGVNKIIFVETETAGNQIVPALMGKAGASLSRQWRLQGCNNGTVATFNLPTFGAMPRGVWEFWEVIFILNSGASTLDASIQTFINGTLRQTATNFRITGTGCQEAFGSNWDTEKCNPTWGSSNPDTNPNFGNPTGVGRQFYDQTLNTLGQGPFYMYMDKLIVKGKV